MRSVFGSRFRSWLSPLVLLLIVASADSQPSAGRSASAKLVIPINTGWRFREAGKDSWHTATVPGCVHTDLLTHNLIDDPFYRDNEQKQQWIGKTMRCTLLLLAKFCSVNTSNWFLKAWILTLAFI